MVFRCKDAKFGRNGIDQFFGPKLPHHRTIVRAKIWAKAAFFSKSYKNAVIRVFFHAEFISTLKIKLTPMVFEKNARNKIKYLIIIIFYFLWFSLKVTCRIA